jgi:hypothetical protein
MAGMRLSRRNICRPYFFILATNKSALNPSGALVTGLVSQTLPALPRIPTSERMVQNEVTR